MKNLSNDQKEQIIIHVYEEGLCLSNMYLIPQAVNAVLETFGYDDRLKYDAREGIFVWRTWYDY